MPTDTPVSTTPAGGVGFRSERGPILAAMMLAAGLIALDSTILATAVPAITASVGGFDRFPWLFSVYLLAQAVTVPLYGKLADAVGRKPVLLGGIAVFALGSLLCGLATGMTWLIVFRAVQGIGAGAIMPMTMTMASDLYTLRERATVQGYMASVWAASSVLGPLLGGLFADYLDWRWIFLVNLPLSAVAGWMLIRHFHERRSTARGPIDALGAVLLTLGAGALILGLLEGGTSWAWGSPAGLGVFAGGGLALLLFVLVERRARDPILPLGLCTRRPVLAAAAVSLLVGAVLMGVTSFVPTFAQGVLGVSALAAGLTVGVLTLGWPVTASQAGRFYLRIGFRRTSLLGSLLCAAGAGTTLLISAASPLWQVALSCFLIGAGLGMVSTPTLIAAQSHAPWGGRGVVTSTVMFTRAIGSAVGVAIFGALVNARVGDVDPPRPADLEAGTHLVFIAVVVAAVAMIAACALVVEPPPEGAQRDEAESQR
ncbi:MDR family MFS transporter [Nocardia jiangsuensis]|uniref:MDR family MFS transporter n=1 Tax=Nocardia jiangsuensis TaxID=1691563 RepID=A0ABV8DXJ3_9NOCA